MNRRTFLRLLGFGADTEDLAITRLVSDIQRVHHLQVALSRAAESLDEVSHLVRRYRLDIGGPLPPEVAVSFGAKMARATQAAIRALEYDRGFDGGAS